MKSKPSYLVVACVITCSLLFAPAVSQAQSDKQLNTEKISQTVQYMNTDQLRSLITILSSVVKQLQKQLEATDGSSYFSDTPDNQTYTKTFRGQEFTLQTKYEGNNTWRYRITGALPNPCWDSEVKHIESVGAIQLTAYPPREGRSCRSVIDHIEKVGTVQSGPDLGFIFYVVKHRGDDTID